MISFTFSVNRGLMTGMEWSCVGQRSKGAHRHPLRAPGTNDEWRCRRVADGNTGVSDRQTSQQRGVDSPTTNDRRFREFGTVSPLRVSSSLTLRAHTYNN